MQNNPPSSRRNKRRRSKSDGEPASWRDVDPQTVSGFVLLAEVLDGAVRFGRSRDGAVYSIGFYVGDEHYTEWIRNDSERDDRFTALFNEMVEDYGLSLPLFDGA